MPPTNVELAAKVDELTQRVEQLETQPDTPEAISGFSSAASTGVGSLVEYDTTDPLLETPISGVGLVVDRNDDGVLVAPLQVQGLRLKDDEVATPGTRAAKAEAEA